MSPELNEDQLQPEETLDDRNLDDVLDEGYSPPDREPRNLSDPALDGGSETLDERLAEEEPEVWDTAEGEMAGEEAIDVDEVDQVGDDRTGRLSEGFDGDIETDAISRDVGIDGAGASSEEAAIHTIED